MSATFVLAQQMGELPSQIHPPLTLAPYSPVTRVQIEGPRLPISLSAPPHQGGALASVTPKGATPLVLPPLLIGATIMPFGLELALASAAPEPPRLSLRLAGDSAVTQASLHPNPILGAMINRLRIGAEPLKMEPSLSPWGIGDLVFQSAYMRVGDRSLPTFGLPGATVEGVTLVSYDDFKAPTLEAKYGITYTSQAVQDILAAIPALAGQNPVLYASLVTGMSPHSLTVVDAGIVDATSLRRLRTITPEEFNELYNS